MKILIITIHADPTIPPGAREGGGTHLYINELINMLIYRKAEALIITRKASPGNETFTYGDVKIRRMRLGPEATWDKNNFDDREGELLHMIQDIVADERFQPDLIHSVYWHSGRAAAALSDKWKKPFIHSVISAGMRKKITGYPVSEQRLATERLIFGSAKIIIAVSVQEKDDLINYYQVSSSKVKVIGRAVDQLFLASLYDDDGTLLPLTEPRIQGNHE
ncbi:glycosyltransferase [Mucilaginibacter angelicae]|uniref:Glycosyltransferase n=1 Tax=Mucilaginibacter angelicae TaxID=869718 RepID=A0ABV6LA63_9SPHI